MPELTEDVLIRRTLDGDEGAFAELVRRYQRRVVVTLRGVMYDLSDEETEDFAQDIFLLVFRSLSSFRGEAQFGTWLTRIALRHAWREAKRRRRRRRTEISYDADEKMEEAIRGRAESGATSDRDLIADERKDAVRKALALLPEEFRTVLMMRIIEEMPVEQVAEILEVSSGTVKSRLHRAREKMREMLGEGIW